MTQKEPAGSESMHSHRTQLAVDASQPLSIWRFTDGTSGHSNQSLGLVQALSRIVPTHMTEICVQRSIFTRPQLPITTTPPDILIGAGQRTHRTMLRVKSTTDARAIVLMRPSVPAEKFDLCIVPEHDGVPASANTILTCGALNTVQKPEQKNSQLGLIAIGGPSQHHDWLDAELIAQIRAITRDSTDPIRWTVANSRRTPQSTWDALTRLKLPGVGLAHWRAQEEDWFARTMTNATEAWVSEDSVSMLYEAMTSGAAVGVLTVPRRGAGRVLNGVTRLIARGLVTPYSLWQGGKALSVAVPALAEADRCAQLIVDRWLTAN